MAKTLKHINGMPNVSSALSGWTSPIKLVKLNSSIIDGRRVDTEEVINTRGTIQPLKEWTIQTKPAELRAFEWLQIHHTAPRVLSVNDRIIINGYKWTVQALKDYEINGYIELHAVKDFQ